MRNFEMSPVPKLDSLEDFPLGSSFPSFYITEKNAGWRVFRPVIDLAKCVQCHRCYLLCPDGAIHKTPEGTFEVDYDFCKGCGICAHECKLQAITMKKEGSE